MENGWLYMKIVFPLNIIEVYTSDMCHFVPFNHFASSHFAIVDKHSIQYFRIGLLLANPPSKKKSDDESALQSGRFVTLQVLIGIDKHT